jgi:uncharacterized protein (TIGR03545 family)
MTAPRKWGILRPPGLLVFAFVLVVIGLLWWLFADTLVKHAIERTGASIVGAKVELDAVDLRPMEGAVHLTHLRVANPESPMRNLLEADRISVDLLMEPLLAKKIVVQDLAVTGVRFNTPRETAGALEHPDPEAGAAWRQVNQWASHVQLPSLSLQGLGGVVRTEAISADSLRTVQRARALVAGVDSMRTTWEDRVRELDPRPRMDSLQVVVQRLENFRLTPRTALQVPGLLRDGRSALDNLTRLRGEIGTLDQTVRAGIDSLQAGAAALPALRQEDLAYARSLLNIPTLEAPEISPALFGSTALAWLKPVLYWVRTAERYLPPGLDPRKRPGPERTRAQGTTVEFPGRAAYPRFLLERGELGLELGGSGAAAGRYTARLQDLTTAPALVGKPLRIQVGREAGVQGPRGLSLAGVLDHTGDVLRDSVALNMTGVELPSVSIGPLGAGLDLGAGTAGFEVRRVGDRLDARLHWASQNVSWTRTGGADTLATAGSPRPGSPEWARDLVWRTLSGIGRVEIDMRLSGNIDRPSVSVSSNLGQAVATSMRRELGAQIDTAEARMRQEVDRQVQPLIQQARSRVDAVRTGIAQQVDQQRQQVEELRARLEARLRDLSGG